jgi:hypothetical protein
MDDVLDGNSEDDDQEPHSDSIDDDVTDHLSVRPAKSAKRALSSFISTLEPEQQNLFGMNTFGIYRTYCVLHSLTLGFCRKMEIHR